MPKYFVWISQQQEVFCFFDSEAVQQIECEEDTGFGFEKEIDLLITKITVQPNVVFLHGDLKTELKNLHKICLMIEG